MLAGGNRYNTAYREISLGFRHSENVKKIYSSLSNHFHNPLVDSYLNDHLNGAVVNYAKTIEEELNGSDAIPGITMRDQMNCFTNQFINQQIGFITTHVVGDSDPLSYSVTDGVATSRNNINHYQKSTNDILDSWRSGPQKQITLRGDSDALPTIYGIYNDDLSTMHTGVRFCDQSAMGTANHVEQFENSFNYHGLNNTDRPHELTAFGVSTPAADARLLSRRIFRSEGGVENAIPIRRICRRNMDTDISETLRQGEYDGMSRGYDMSTLRQCVDVRNALKNKYLSEQARYG